MSDLRFGRALGAEFERLEREGAGRRRLAVPRLGSVAGGLAVVATVAVPVVIAVLALAVTGGHSARRSFGAARSGPGGSSQARPPLVTGNGSCDHPALSVLGGASRAALALSHQPSRLASGSVAGTGWTLTVPDGTVIPYGIENGRLELGGRRYGLCATRTSLVEFGLIDAGSHAIIYGQAPTLGGAVHVSLPGTASGTLVTNDADSFFIRALPESACRYGSITVLATSQVEGRGLPPAITASLNADRTTFRTTETFVGACRAHELVPVTHVVDAKAGRSLAAPLAIITATIQLVRSGTSAGAGQVTVEHNGAAVGIGVLFFPRGTPARGESAWLKDPTGRAYRLGLLRRHDAALQGNFDLPANARRYRLVEIASSLPGHPNQIGRIAASGTFRDS
jgi:hypothetical protein